MQTPELYFTVEYELARPGQPGFWATSSPVLPSRDRAEVRLRDLMAEHLKERVLRTPQRADLDAMFPERTGRFRIVKHVHHVVFSTEELGVS